MVSQLQMFSLGVLWVGGWSFILFEYPRIACRVLRDKTPTEKRLRHMRMMGGIGLVWVAVSCAVTFVVGFFH